MVVFFVVVVVLVAVVLVLVVVVRTRLFHARDRCRSCQIQAVHAHRSTCHSRPGVLRSHQSDCVISDWLSLAGGVGMAIARVLGEEFCVPLSVSLRLLDHPLQQLTGAP